MMDNTDRAQDALQLEALLVSRCYLYELFHKLFGGAPDAELVEVLLGDVTADVIDEFAGGEGGASEAGDVGDDAGAGDAAGVGDAVAGDASEAAGVAEASSAADAACTGNDAMRAFGAFLATLREYDPAALLDRAHDEYTRIFVGPAALPASPYESPYMGAHDMSLFQENTLAVRELYHTSGLRVRREQAVPDDHVSIMCAYLVELSRRALAAFHAGDGAVLAARLREAGAFAETHLANWIGVFAQSVRNSKAGAAAVMYPQLLEALAAFVRADIGFTVEAAYWAQGQELGTSGPAVELAPAYEMLERLAAIHPFGIQDNELIPLDL